MKVTLLMLCYCLLAAGTLTAQNISRIAFGSCISQNNPQEVWYTVDSFKPDVFVFLGDNLYGDTEDMTVLRQKYEMLFGKEPLQKFLAHTKTLAVWDDHDYGINDGGKEYPKR